MATTIASTARTPSRSGPSPAAATGAGAAFRPAQRGFLGRLRELLAGRAPAPAAADLEGDSVHRLRPAAATGRFARFCGRIETVSQDQRLRAQGLLGQLQATGSRATGVSAEATGPGTDRLPSALHDLIRACAHEWPDQVFDRVFDQLTQEGELAGEIRTYLSTPGVNADQLLSQIQTACRASDTLGLRSASRGAAIFAAVVAHAGDADAQARIARLQSQFKAIQSAVSTPFPERLVALEKLLGGIDTTQWATRSQETAALRREAVALQQQLTHGQGTIEGAFLGQIALLRDTSAPLGQRVASVKDLEAMLKAVPVALGAAARGRIDQALHQARVALLAEMQTIPDRAFAPLRALAGVEPARAPQALEAARATLQDLALALSLGPDFGLADAEVAQSQSLLAWASDQLAVLETPVPALRRCRELARDRGELAASQLADWIVGLPLANRLIVSQRLQQLFEAVQPARRDEVLQALARAVATPSGAGGAGATQPSDAFTRSLCPALTDSPSTLAAILRGVDWREEVNAFELTLVDAQEHAIRLGVPADLARCPTGQQDFNARRLKIDARFNQLKVSDELNQVFQRATVQAKTGLHIGGDGARGPATAFTALAPSEALLAALKKVAPATVTDIDLLLVQWIQLSAAADLITQDKAEGLCRAVIASTPGAGGDLDLEKAVGMVKQGFRSTDEVVRCRKALEAFAAKLKAANLVTQADRQKDPLVYAEFLVAALYERVTGTPPPEEFTDEAIEQGIRARLRQVEETHLGTHRALDARVTALKGLIASGRLPGEGLRDGKTTNSERPVAQLLQSLPNQVTKLDALLAYLAAAEALQALPSQVSDSDPRATALARTMQDSLERLSGFNPATLNFEAGAALPSHSQLKPLLAHKQAIEELRNILGTIAKLESGATAGLAQYQKEMTPLIEAISHLAIFQEALRRQDPALRLDTAIPGPSTVGNQVVKQMAQLGLRLDLLPEYTEVRKKYQAQVEALTKADGRLVKIGALPELCGALDPTTTSARVRELWAGGSPRNGSSGQAPSSPSATGGPAETKAGPPPAAKPGRDRLAARMKGLEVGHAFSIRFGRYGDQAVTQPVAPGVSVSVEAGGEKFDGIHVQRQQDGYVVEVFARAEARFGVSLKAFNDALSVGVRGAASRGDGLTFHFKDAATCESMIRSLTSGQSIDLAAWREVRVAQGQQSGLMGRVEAVAALGLGEAIASVQAALSAQTDVTLAVHRSGAEETEVVARRVALIAQAHVAGAGGRVQGDAEAGLDRTVRRSVTRSRGLLTEGRVELCSRVVNGNVKATLKALMPGLPPGKVDTLAQEIGEVDASGELALQCRLTDEAMGRANAHLRRARQGLLEAALSVGGSRLQQAQAEAQAAVKAAELELQKPSSYRVERVQVRQFTQVQATASRGVYTNAATSRDDKARTVDLDRPAAEAEMAAEGEMAAGSALPASYTTWLSFTPGLSS